MAVRHGRCPALICGLILDIADVYLEWRQPTHVDQAVVLAAINISSRVFTSVARDDLTDQLEILIVHVASSLVEIAVYFFRGRTEGNRRSAKIHHGPEGDA